MITPTYVVLKEAVERLALELKSMDIDHPDYASKFQNRRLLKEQFDKIDNSVKKNLINDNHRSRNSK